MKKNDYFVIADQYIDSMGNLYGRDEEGWYVTSVGTHLTFVEYKATYESDYVHIPEEVVKTLLKAGVLKKH